MGKIKVKSVKICGIRRGGNTTWMVAKLWVRVYGYNFVHCSKELSTKLTRCAHNATSKSYITEIMSMQMGTHLMGMVRVIVGMKKSREINSELSL